MDQYKRYFAAAAAAFALATGATSASGQQLHKLNVAIGSTSFAWLPLYVADGAGYFKDEGLDVELTNVAANATPVAAILSRSADIAGIGVLGQETLQCKKFVIVQILIAVSGERWEFDESVHTYIRLRRI